MSRLPLRCRRLCIENVRWRMTTRLRLGFDSRQLDCSRLTRDCNTRDTCKANWNANLKDGVYARGRWSATPIVFPVEQKFCLYFYKYPFTLAKEREEKERKRQKNISIDWYYDDCFTGKLRGFASITGSLGNLYTYEANKFSYFRCIVSFAIFGTLYLLAADTPSKAFK